MTLPFPCIRHGHASTADERLVDMVADAETLGLERLGAHIVALLDYDGQLWATWRDDAARSAGSDILTRAWALAGGERGALHLIRSADDYDYQEDCMNDATA